MATLKDLLVSGPARVIGNITGKSFIKEGGTSSQFLKADGSVDTNSYSTTSHNHSGVYKPVQTAVSDPTASTTTSTTFIDSISQNANGVITATKKTLPSYASSSHTHTTTIATSTGTNQITLEHGGKYSITAGGTSYVFTMPSQYSHPTSAGNKHVPSGGASGQFLGWSANGTATWVGNPNTDYSVDQVDFTDSSFWHGIMLSHENITDIDFGNNALRSSNGGVGFSNRIFLNPSSGAIVSMGGYYDANGTSVSYEGHTHDYSASNHTHTTTIATSSATNQITLAFGTKYAITAGGTSYVFTMPSQYSHPTSAGNKHVPSGGSSGKFLGWSADGTATWVNNPNTDQNVNQGGNSTNDWHGLLATKGTTALGAKPSDDTTNILFGGNNKGPYVNFNKGTIAASGFVCLDGKNILEGLLKADGTVDTNSYALSSHTHNYAASSHSHGSITSGGAISSGTELANGDAIVFADSSDGDKLKKSTITFNGSTTTKFLSQKGTWETPSGGSTVAGKSVELSTSDQALITVNGSDSGHVKLPDDCPWLADPANHHDTIGGVTPIFVADTPNFMVNSSPGSFSDIRDVTGVSTEFLFPDVRKSRRLYALPVAMDNHGHLFVLISEDLAANVFLNYNMSPDAGVLRGE